MPSLGSSSPSPIRAPDGGGGDSWPQEPRSRQESLQNGFTNTEETSDDGSASANSRRPRRKKKKPWDIEGLVGYPMPITFDLAKIRTGEEVNEVTEEDQPEQDAITWEAIVYDDSKDDPHNRFERFRSSAVAKYLDNQPIELTETKPDRKDLRAFDANAAIALPIKKLDLESWSGPVFTIKLQALAKMPWLQVSHVVGSDYDRRARRRDRDLSYDAGLDEGRRMRYEEYSPRRRDKSAGMIYNKHRLPKSLAGHDITLWSPPTITIKSPFLYDTLSNLITHYPSFEGLGQRFKPKVGCDFPYPYGCIMHHLPQIKEFAYSSGPLKLNRDDKDKPEEEQEEDPKVLEKKKDHMKILYEHLQPSFELNLLAYQQALNEEKPKVSFEMLWYLLKPGTEVYVRDSWTSFYKGMITYVNSEQNNYGEVRWWEIGIWFLMSDGARVGRVMSPETFIHWYDGMMEVTSLDVCPAEIWDKTDGGARRKLALERGRLFEKSLRHGHLLANYDAASSTVELSNSGKVIVDHRRGKDMTGLGLQSLGFVPGDKDVYDPWDHIHLNEPWKWPAEELPRYVASDMVGDSRADPYGPPVKKSAPRTTVPLAAASRIPPSSARAQSSKKTGEKDITPTMTDQQVSMFYPLTFGFSLKTKQWIEMDTSRLREIEPSSESMENLVIGDDELKTIKALASRLSKNSSWEADYIRGKGSGGIILLHGPPGVGKTYTVESIAEFLHLPLLALTIADIGTVETRIESELSRWLSLAEYWKCVLLIDEADIFLERRQNRDLARNGLVSAFLRRAEYFKGLLFLTTNRVGQIDDAFISRVHVAIQYRSLTNEDLQRIWKGFFSKLARERKGHLQVAPDAKKWVLDVFGKGQYGSLNGRDIRNALQTAITLAEFESEEDPDFDASEGMVVIISKQHFERVLEMSHRFHDYVAGIRMEDEKKRAHARGDRNDYTDDDSVSLPLRDRRK